MIRPYLANPFLSVRYARLRFAPLSTARAAVRGYAAAVLAVAQA